jgi:hypothetical protein
MMAAPAPTAPRISSGLAQTSSKKHSLRWCGPSIDAMGRTSMPSRSIGSKKMVMPCARPSPPGTRAAKKQ